MNSNFQLGKNSKRLAKYDQNSSSIGRMVFFFLLKVKDLVDANGWLLAEVDPCMRIMSWDVLLCSPSILSYERRYLLSTEIAVAGFPLMFLRFSIVFHDFRKTALLLIPY